MTISSHGITARIADGQDRHRRGVTGRIGAEQDYENTLFILSPSIKFLSTNPWLIIQILLIPVD